MAAYEDRILYVAGSPATDEARVGRRISSNIPFILGSLVMLLVVAMVGIVDQVSTHDPVTRTTAAANVGYDRAVKPYMYQFDVVSQDASGEPYRKIPFIWNQVWESAGWTPLKLMVGKVAAEPRFNQVLKKLENVNPIQRRHVYKYLAMSASGGGWVGHSDTFPLHPFGSSLELPNEGRMTVYGGPCLMSGNATEWLRMGARVAEHARVYHLRDEWTEALALEQMQMDYTLVKDDIFEVPNSGSDVEIQWTWNSQDCQATKRNRAVHFRLGENERFSSMNDPGDMVIKWLSMWLQSCQRSTHFIDLELGRREQAVEQPVIQAGSYHAPVDYDGAEQSAVVAAPENTTADEEVPPQPPVKAGTFHVDETYETKPANEPSRLLRLRAQAMDGAV
jgi:hypothetical protein